MYIEDKSRLKPRREFAPRLAHRGRRKCLQDQQIRRPSSALSSGNALRLRSVILVLCFRGKHGNETNSRYPRTVRICLLTNQDLDADPFTDDDWPCDPRPFFPEADWHVAVLEKHSSVKTIKALAQKGFDVFFNLCDGAAEENSPGIEVVMNTESGNFFASPSMRNRSSLGRRIRAKRHVVKP